MVYSSLYNEGVVREYKMKGVDIERSKVRGVDRGLVIQ